MFSTFTMYKYCGGQKQSLSISSPITNAHEFISYSTFSTSILFSFPLSPSLFLCFFLFSFYFLFSFCFFLVFEFEFEFKSEYEFISECKFEFEYEFEKETLSF